MTRTILQLAAATCLLTAAAIASATAPRPGPGPATGRLVEVQVFDRAQGRRLEVYRHEGRLHVVGTPGSEYSIRLHNRSGSDVLAVLSVDGVNAITGETAAPDQAGYVIGRTRGVDIRGWRKDLQRTAAFHFTARAEAYATRTGRPDDVGVIGIAVFRRQPAAAPLVMAPGETLPSPSTRLRRGAEPGAEAAADTGAGAGDRAEAARSAAAPSAALGTGHGRSEHAPVRLTGFQRATVQPEEIVELHYDSLANLVARGIVPSPAVIAGRVPRAFPGAVSFVPDPPVR